MTNTYDDGGTPYDNPSGYDYGPSVSSTTRLRWFVDVGSVVSTTRLRWQVAPLVEPQLNQGFFQDMEQAMLDKVSGLRVFDSATGPKGPGTSGRLVEAWFHRPQAAAKGIRYPYITLDFIDYHPAHDRMQQGYVENLPYAPVGFVAGDGVSTFLSTDEFPIPYDFVWQITVVSEFFQHDRQLGFELLADDRLPPRGGYLVVNNTYRYMTVSGPLHADFERQNAGSPKRYFRKIYTVTATAELFQRDLALLVPPTTLVTDVVVQTSAQLLALQD